MNKVNIELIGCDDTTEFEIEVTEEEIKFLDKLKKLSAEISRSSCMPVLEFETIEEKHEENSYAQFRL